jgi:hypothetical protein
MDTEASALLDDLGTLRRRARQDSHGFWLPLLLFGVLILVAPVVYGAAAITVPANGSFDSFGPDLHIGGLHFYPLSLFTSFPFEVSPLAVGFYWLGVAVVGTLVTLGWYRWRAVRVGVQPHTSTYLLYACAALLVCVLPVPIAAGQLINVLGGFGKPAVFVSVAVFVFGIALTVLSARGRRWTVVRRIGLVIGVILLLIGTSDLTIVASTYGFGGLFVIAIGLLGLAWMERSRLCATVALLFTGAALLANLYGMENVFYRLFGGDTTSTLVSTFEDLVLPAAVLIIGGIVSLVAGRGSRQ